MKRSIFTILISGLFVVSGVNAQAIEKFTNPIEMFEEFSDYVQDNNTLKVESEKPLKVRLGKSVFKGDSQSVIESQLKRALIYGVYRPFIHTDVDEITVRAVALETTINPYSQKLLKSPAYEVRISRENALKAVKTFLPVVDFDGLLDENGYWTADFNKLYYDDQGAPGLSVFFDTLSTFSK
ncbi:hypothetical protein KOE80_19125 [Alcaligenes sp. 13f]|uniref:hypothetical protein n=1 Tax=Alcaligenes sp. 13f TaxID=2841924 RepID=UPI001CF69096|nr:hypothetical protein [Alcaligenes sp. 13f]MCB4324320.1 hypothetical protein [Alcaligenes sp. 13f]